MRVGEKEGDQDNLTSLWGSKSSFNKESSQNIYTPINYALVSHKQLVKKIDDSLTGKLNGMD